MVRVGRVVGAFGVEGAVKVTSLTDFPDRFAPGSELFLDGSRRRVEWSRAQPNPSPPLGGRWPGRAGGGLRLTVKLEGVDSRSGAETLRGHYLEIPEEELRPLPDGRWYHHQLVGLAVATESGDDLGTLADVLPRPANDVWVARLGDEERLIPATRDAVVAVDLDAGRVTVADWLLDPEDA